jgi:hypothetical protein
MPKLEMTPTAGLKDQVTAVLEVLLTVALNCRDCELVNDAVGGVTETVAGGTRFTTAVADLVGSAELVAVT